ncbi:MAG TPA: tripartite tricarboxylate transporter substrate binding protein [Burkholderiales bacterium]|nr:tripartite tricarboxylate transporter substrate binding protein [Burkholderiales bacterium]
MQPLILSALAVLFLLLQVALPAFAADAWPTRPIRLLVPFAPGGSTDITARVLAEGLRGVLGQTVVVDNRSGASGNIAGETAAKAIPDGYTFLISSTTLLVNMYIQKNPRYDYVKELAPVTQTNWSTNVLVVNPSVPAATLPEFIAHVKGGARVTYGTAGHGSSQHLAGALFNNMVKGNMLQVPYKGGAPAMVALLGGEVQSIFAPLIESLPHIKTGLIKPLGVCGKKRSALLPNTPHIGEFLPGYETTSWTGILAPARTPPDIVNRMQQAIVKVMNQPSVKTHFAEADKEQVGSTPAEFRQFIASEADRIRMQVKIAGAWAD